MCISVFGKRLSRKSNNAVVFPFAFHIAVQQPFKSLWSRLLLYDLEPSQASFSGRRKLLDDLKERRGYSHLKEEAVDRTMWRARFERGFGPVVRQTTK
jgi:hypothetical protein